MVKPIRYQRFRHLQKVLIMAFNLFLLFEGMSKNSNQFEIHKTHNIHNNGKN